jgi:neutral ceramidase
MLTVFTNGAAGNINHIDVMTQRLQKGHEEAARIGTVLADDVLKTYARLKPAKGVALGFAAKYCNFSRNRSRTVTLSARMLL